jgi:hypothetical protein
MPPMEVQLIEAALCTEVGVVAVRLQPNTVTEGECLVYDVPGFNHSIFLAVSMPKPARGFESDK